MIFPTILTANKNDFSKIGFCFSYPTEIFPNKDGKLLYWTKEIKIPRMAGQFIGKNLLEKNFAVVNCWNSQTRSGAEVTIKWKNKDLFNL